MRRTLRTLALTFAAALWVVCTAAFAAAPVSFDRDVSDMTPWLKPFEGAAETAKPKAQDTDNANKRWLSLELANPTKQEIHRIVTLDPGAGGVLNFLNSSGPVGLFDVLEGGEGGTASLIAVGGGKAADIRLTPLATSTVAFYSEGPIETATWRMWKPEALAAAKQTETLVLGLLAGAALAMVAWLSGLAVFRRSAEPAWAALSLTALIVLILGGSILPVPPQALYVTGAVMIACALRYITTHLALDYARPKVALIFDGAAFALIGFAVSAALGVAIAELVVQGLAVAAPAIAAVLALSEAMRTEVRAKALIPGIVIMIVAIVGPGLLPAGFSHQIASLSLIADALFTSGAIALAFAAAVPSSRVADEAAVQELSDEQRKSREVEYRYSLGLAAAHQGLWDWNYETDTLFLSPSVEALLGLEGGALASSERKWAELIAQEDVQLYADSMNAHRRQGNSSFTLEMRMRHAKGGTRWIQLRASCIAGANGKAVRCIGVVSDITGRKAQESQRQNDETSDNVTGLMLRSGFLARLDGVLASMQTGLMRRSGAILAVDVDRLRVVTDSLGHQAGDQFLSQIARRLDHAAGPDDAVARLGNDEFAVLALGSRGDEDGAKVAQRIRDALTQPVAIGDREIYPAASIGLALIEPSHRFGGDVLREAEIAMYHAKRVGRGGFEIYQPQMKARSPDRLIMDADLRTALDRRQIEMHYQPIVRLEDGSVAGFEALMRWRHPKRGLLAPGEFIALAEETGLITPLGRYALETSANELKRWQTYFPLHEPLFCSVNVSGRQLFRQEFYDDVVAVLRNEKLSRMTLKLELTESVIMQNPESTARALARMKEAGAGLALDDFGTGFSSLSYLQRFPFDTVKIDRSFITDMARNEETPVILKSIIRLAHDLDMSVVAEGVETQSESSRLKSLRCEFAQGFLFGAPMDATAAYNFIALKARGLSAPKQLSGPGSSPARIPR
ncbi:MAG: EAL domain-containing protein [Alphaproteobacteria bacterium]|nr:EAL domain-containing protein [Alphaproteobacteria bacterium]